MKPTIEIVFGAPVVLFRSEAVRAIKHNTAAAKFQSDFEESLRCTGRDMSEIAIARRARHAKKQLESYYRKRDHVK